MISKHRKNFEKFPEFSLTMMYNMVYIIEPIRYLRTSQNNMDPNITHVFLFCETRRLCRPMSNYKQRFEQQCQTIS